MSQLNIAKCDDCGVMARSTYRAYNRCPKCYLSTETIIGDTDAELLVNGLIKALIEKGASEDDVVDLLETIERDGDDVE
ncbi:MAG: hypothetical protein CMN72_15865 [Sphingomonas sp.]|nr:hypothetical protein [Sphingomonas sp.]|tara:strand:+ start:91 stop:327 length:237 start_codon:yes stop_codon:yes gene_type:complete